MRAFRNWLKKESGQSVIIIALALVVLCGFAALGVDIAVQSTNQGQLQNAADAAALAAARELPSASTAKTKAAQYAQTNGVDSGNTVATTPYKGNANKIEVVCKETVQFSFARIFGLKSTEITARAVAEKTGLTGGPFGYAIFSGSKNSRLGLFQSDLTVNGSIHGNQEVMMNGTNLKVTGNVEAVGQFSTSSSSITVTGTAQGSPAYAWGGTSGIAKLLNAAASVVDIAPVDLAAAALAKAQANGTYYNGNQTFGSSLNLDKCVYVNGDVTLAGPTFTGVGMLVATGNITIASSSIEASSAASVCIYSTNGNIEISTQNVRVDGVLYAPKGRIQCSQANCVINGRVIGNEVQLNGTNTKVLSGSNDLAFLPGGGVTLVE